MDGSIVWKIGWNTKWGQDVILVRQDSRPTKKQLSKMYKNMLSEYDVHKEDERFYVEVIGCIGLRDIPFLDDYIDEWAS